MSNEAGDGKHHLTNDVRKVVYGSHKNAYGTDLIKGIIIHIRNEENTSSSKNMLISMLENLLLQTDIDKKKRILTEEYGMIMNTELEGRIQTMCNLSENIEARGIEKGIEQERMDAIERMLRAGAVKEQIISFGYSEEEVAKVEDMMCVNP